MVSLEDAKSSKEASSTVGSNKAINVPRDKSASNEPTTPVANFKKAKSYETNYTNSVNSNASDG